MSSVKYYDIDDEGVKTMKKIHQMLTKVKFQTSGNRKVLTHDQSRPSSMPCGMKKELSGLYGLPAFDKQNPEIYPVIRDFINKYAPDFDFNSGYINKNVQMIPHKDKNNVDTSLIFGLGDYEQGRLFVEGKGIDIKWKLIEFDGKREEHWTEFFTGDRYSVVIYKI